MLTKSVTGSGVDAIQTYRCKTALPESGGSISAEIKNQNREWL
jgi:hypothetical protein